ncbi:NADP-dependent oxidoreductase domain-containing protein [Pisolithus sp. B1]|nr:NADP-dependent oxidoreductase domain-containing protein [Pisolithus sp. B1]
MPVSELTLNDGTRTPWIAFGTGTALYGKDVQQSVTVAIQNGFTHLDGAQQYHNEDSLGAAIAASGKPRSELYITTKLGKLKPGDTPKSALEESLRKLRVDYVDLLQDVWIGMEEAKNAGLTKSIGVSNFTSDHLSEILEVATIPPAVNQLEVHPYVWKALQPNLSLHQKYNIVTSSYGGLSPLVRGRGGPLDPVVENIRARLARTRGSAVSEGQVLHKYYQQKGILVVTTSAKVERIQEYLDTENVPELTPDEIEDIEAAGTKLHKRFFPGNWPPE